MPVLRQTDPEKVGDHEMKLKPKPGSLAAAAYDAGYKAGISGTIELVLKAVMAKLYDCDDYPNERLVEMKDGIQDAIFYYKDHPRELKEDVKTMEEAGIIIRFDGK